MRYRIGLTVLLLATGCGGASNVDDPKTQPSTSTSPTPAKPVAAGLRDTCDAVGAAVPSGYADTYDAAKMNVFLTKLIALNNSADRPTREALRPLAEPVASLAGGAGVEAHQQFLDALDDLAADCTAAGSSALQ